MAIEPPVLRAAFVSGEAWSVLAAGMPSYHAVMIGTKINNVGTALVRNFVDTTEPTPGERVN